MPKTTHAYRKPGVKPSRFFSLTVQRDAFDFCGETYGDLTDRASTINSLVSLLRLIRDGVLLPEFGDRICFDVAGLELPAEVQRVGACVLATAPGGGEVPKKSLKKASDLCVNAVEHLRALQMTQCEQPDLFWSGEFDESAFPEWPTEDRHIAMIELMKAGDRGDLKAELSSGTQLPVEIGSSKPADHKLGLLRVDGTVDGVRHSTAKVFLEGRVTDGDDRAMALVARHRYFDCTFVGDKQFRELAVCMSERSVCRFVMEVNVCGNRPAFTLVERAEVTIPSELELQWPNVRRASDRSDREQRRQ